MDLKSCMNFSCGTKSSTEWKTGWRLRSGEFVNLCDKCGYAFEQCIYCEEFHANEPGWRECVTCGKRLHCGCIASLSLIELLDGGGVKCIGCARNLDPISSLNDGKCDGSRPSALTLSNGGLKQLSDYNGINGNYQPLGQVGGTSGSNLAQSPIDLFQKAKLHMSAINIQVKDHFEAIAQPNLNITLGIPTGNLHSTSMVVNDVKDNRKVSNAFHQGFGTHHLLSRPPKLALSPVPDTNASVVPSIRVARPPVEGRGRHQLLPRYWPRITDQELQQISGDSNCTIVPLFEKVLSASDAGRIGRLVLPKACAEAYFPPISQPEGLPIKIQDVKGKEWVFQFRFWPNNNSRMYVLEGVTPCIHSMELQAGDTVTFSRIDPGGKLVMGFRKASTSISMQPTKGSSDPHMNALSRQLDTAGGNIRWPNSEKYGERVEDGLLAASTPLERKKSRNMGSKSKRLLIDSQDVVALRLSWDEVQGLLRPPQNARPNIVVVDDYEFEEYEEPPVFGKSSIFTACSSGAIEQWAQCDSCFKWRRLPADILLPPRWTCSENVWDKSRCFCSASDDLGLKELENLLQQSKDSKKRRMAMTSRMIHDKESTGLDALANAATLGDNTNDPSSSSVAATTKHPRHRPGCSCIVCIQPPSGKGKHKSTCTCTVCMTVKRRFKTLMMRKKKRQSEQEAEIALKNQLKESPNTLQEADNRPGEAEDYSRVGPSLNHDGGASAESGKGLDLNCDPEREEDIKAGPIQESLRDLLRLAGLPLESYMKQNGLTCLTCEQQGGGLGTQLGQGTGETECQTVEDNLIAQQERVNPGDVLDNKQQNEEPS